MRKTATLALLIAVGLFQPGQAAICGVISIIIDDIGYKKRLGLEALALPDGVTLSILPDAPYSKALYIRAVQTQHELMLHLPMQSEEQTGEEPGVLTTAMSAADISAQLTRQLQQFPRVKGVNNHMGSGLTGDFPAMDALMQTLSHTPELYFVDSRTTTSTVAQYLAVSHSVPSTRRDVFLDNTPDDEASIQRQFDLLIKLSTKNGHALAIGHPHASTLAVIKKNLKLLEQSDIQLLSVSDYIEHIQKEL